MTPKQIRNAALEEAARVVDAANDVRCEKCGAPRSNHPYRHPFVGTYPLDLAAVLRALKEQEPTT